MSWGDGMSRKYNPLTRQNKEQAARSKYVRKKLIDLGMNQRELAAMVPMRYQYLNNMLQGVKTGDKYWQRIIEILEAAEADKRP